MDLSTRQEFFPLVEEAHGRIRRIRDARSAFGRALCGAEFRSYSAFRNPPIVS
jgi:hypothetical protein